MLRKHLFLAFILSSFYYSGFAQMTNDKKEVAFATTAKAIIDNFYKKNVKQLGSYIDPQNGVYIMYRPGAEDAYKNIAAFDSKDEMIFSHTVLDKPNFLKTALQFGKLPEYSCDKNKWNRVAFAADSSKNYSPISGIAKRKSKFDNVKISKNEFNKIRAVETTSRKIVYAGSREKGIVFYLSWSGTQWYISILDVEAADCEM